MDWKLLGTVVLGLVALYQGWVIGYLRREMWRMRRVASACADGRSALDDASRKAFDDAAMRSDPVAGSFPRFLEAQRAQFAAKR